MDKTSEATPIPIQQDANIARREEQSAAGERSKDIVTQMADNAAKREFQKARALAGEIKSNLGKAPENAKLTPLPK